MSSAFEIQPIGRFVGQSAAIKRPKEIACFSYDDQHQFRLDDSSIRWYYPPTLGADLSRGFDTFQKLDDTADDHLESLLKTIIAHEQKEGKRTEAEFITWRGMMTKLMAAIFSDRDGFEMNATLFQDTIFIEENHAYKLQSHAQQSSRVSQPGRPSQDMMSFWGYKFETLCLLPNTWDETPREYIENRESEIVSNHAQYCSVVRTGIGNSVLVIGGEVDAIWDSKPVDGKPINWVELKTSADIRNDRDMITLERKLMKFWIQSFLLGVPKIIVGFRTPDGILKRVEEMDTASIPGTVKRCGKGTWDGNMCINFAAALLDFIKASITGDGVWRIRRQERSSTIDIFRVEETGHGEILSDEFIDWRIKLALNSKQTDEAQPDAGRQTSEMEMDSPNQNEH
ncbi:related to RAI1-nuclear protein that binds to and stabilizes the exoribonuclease Rat1p, require [Phialocephala subalpina]|uniref:Decapping nuclease n=1 Tax=Phialocephala subalpina TaxID=576137 RepID=A0A1L7X282_9HELO|nr:related to RAI1-nuclear protein that binds to and stabilizes the exoribonuclease Rat1p, require [Phialocephala subalpina]